MCSVTQWPVSVSLPWGIKRCRIASDLASTEHQVAYESVICMKWAMCSMFLSYLTLLWIRRTNLIGEHALKVGDTHFCRTATQASTATLSRRLWSFTRPPMHPCTASRACTVAQGDVHLLTKWRITHHSIDHVQLDIEYRQWRIQQIMGTWFAKEMANQHRERVWDVVWQLNVVNVNRIFLFREAQRHVRVVVSLWNSCSAPFFCCIRERVFYVAEFFT